MIFNWSFVLKQILILQVKEINIIRIEAYLFGAL